MVRRRISAQQERRQHSVVVDRIGIIEKRREATAHRAHAAIAQQIHGLIEHRGDGDVLVFERLEVNQLAELLVPMLDVAAIYSCTDARHDPSRTARTEGDDFEVRREQAAARQQIDLVLHVGRPPRVARAVDLERQPRELIQLFAAGRLLDADTVAGYLGICRHDSDRVASHDLIAAQAQIRHRS